MGQDLSTAAILLHQIDRAVGELEEMRMRAIAVRQNRKAKLAIAIAKQERSVTRNTAAVRDITIAVTNLGPPRQPETRSLISPNAFDCSFELIVLARKHLLDGLLADQPLVFVNAAVEICD